MSVDGIEGVYNGEDGPALRSPSGTIHAACLWGGVIFWCTHFDPMPLRDCVVGWPCAWRYRLLAEFGETELNGAVEAARQHLRSHGTMLEAPGL